MSRGQDAASFDLRMAGSGNVERAAVMEAGCKDSPGDGIDADKIVSFQLCLEQTADLEHAWLKPYLTTAFFFFFFCRGSKGVARGDGGWNGRVGQGR